MLVLFARWSDLVEKPQEFLTQAPTLPPRQDRDAEQPRVLLEDGRSLRVSPVRDRGSCRSWTDCARTGRACNTTRNRTLTCTEDTSNMFRGARHLASLPLSQDADVQQTRVLVEDGCSFEAQAAGRRPVPAATGLCGLRLSTCCVVAKTVNMTVDIPCSAPDDAFGPFFGGDFLRTFCSTFLQIQSAFPVTAGEPPVRR